MFLLPIIIPSVFADADIIEGRADQQPELNRLREEVDQLKQSFESLCQEIRHLSTHVLFHEKALNHINNRAHHRHHRPLDSRAREFRHRFQKIIDSLNKVQSTPESLDDVLVRQPNTSSFINYYLPQNEVRPPPVIQVIKPAPAVRVSSADAGQVDALSSSQDNFTLPDLGEEGHVLILPTELDSPEPFPEAPPKANCSEKSIKRCSVLHEYPCGKVINSTKSFDEEFNDYFNSARRVLKAREDRFFSRPVDIPSILAFLDRQNGYVDASGKTQENSIGEEIDNEMKKDDMIYATCNVIPNRHISLILQQNVKGVINLWQRKDGQPPLYAHVNLTGFRVLGEPLPKEESSGNRRRRETVIMPVETTVDSQPTHSSMDHGFHVHVNGDLSRSCQSTGVHFNPGNVSHGGPLDTVRHAGDLGNLRVNGEGKIDAEYTYPFVSLVGSNSIIGRSMVIHAHADDYGRNKDNEASISSGNSGPKIACCVVEQVDRLPSTQDSASSVNALQDSG